MRIIGVLLAVSLTLLAGACAGVRQNYDHDYGPPISGPRFSNNGGA